MIEITQTYGIEEFKTIVGLYFSGEEQTKKSRTRTIGLLALICFCWLYAALSAKATGFYIFAGIFTLLVLLYLLTQKKIRIQLSAKKALENELASNAGPRKIVFEENQFTVTTNLGTNTYPNSAISSWAEVDHYLALRLEDGKYILLDQKNFGDGELGKLKELVQVTFTH